MTMMTMKNNNLNKREKLCFYVCTVWMNVYRVCILDGSIDDDDDDDADDDDDDDDDGGTSSSTSNSQQLTTRSQTEQAALRQQSE